MVSNFKEKRWSAEPFITKTFETVFLTLDIIFLPTKLDDLYYYLKKSTSSKPNLCKINIKLSGECMVVLGKKVHYDWEQERCLEKSYSACKIVESPDFKLEDCQKLCEP